MKDAVAYDVTLVQVTPVADGSGGFTETTANVEGKGFEGFYSDFHRANGQIPVGDRRVYIFQQSMLDSAGATVDPEKHDQVTYRGITATIQKVDKDPANALWDLQVRPI
jgi:hypothetical protein